MAIFKYSPTPAEDRFWRVLQGVRADVGAAIKSNRTYLTIYNLNAADHEIQLRISKYPDLWMTVLYSLQTTFFISVGRLFDKTSGALSVAKLIETAMKNPQLFSKPALLLRKRFDRRIEGEDPEWLTEYIAKAWEPTALDLKSLLADLAPHCKKFKEVYAPIRNEIYAHRSKKNEEEVHPHFGKTLIGDVENILRFVHTLLIALQALILDGRQPDLTNFSDYEGYVQKVDAEVEAFIKRLV